MLIFPWTFYDHDFNPRSREGSDIISFAVRFSRPEFQSTLPRGERPLLPDAFSAFNPNFNPRSREGSDP